MTKHGAVPVVGRSHMTATKFAFFAEERPTKKLQDPGLSVPGIEVPLLSVEWSEKITDITVFMHCWVSCHEGLK